MTADSVVLMDILARCKCKLSGANVQASYSVERYEILEL